MTGEVLTKKSSGGLLGLKRAYDPLTMESPSTTYWENVDFTLSSLIATPPLGFLGSPSTFDPALDTYIHSGLWRTTLQDLLASLSSNRRRCRSCETTFRSTDGSRSGRTSPKKTQPRSHERKTTTTSTASDISSSQWMSFLILRWSIGLAPLLIWRPENLMPTSMRSSKLPSSGRLLVATDQALSRLQSGEEEV